VKSPPASSVNARETMRANRAESARETAFRRAIWREGVRGYRVHAFLPGRPDIAFPRLRLAVFVNGCFWHRCPVCDPPAPKANADFWQDKFTANVRRDADVRTQLRRLGWEVLTIWEHEIRPDPLPRAREFHRQLVAMREQGAPIVRGGAAACGAPAGK
jgi:DNA mismatch endonuclease (patch repair protein)